MKHIIEIEGLSKHFKLKAGLFTSGKQSVKALNEISFSIEEGISFGIVGESGSGKSTLAKALAGAYHIDSGYAKFNLSNTPEISLSKQLSLGQFRKQTNGKIKYIFQDPASSMNPRMTVKQILLSGYKSSALWEGEEKALEKAKMILKKTGLPENILHRRPTDFSGGQRQRISIARALMFNPEVLICDEVVSALDLSIQSQILNLLSDLKKEFNYTLIFISHDLTVVSYICDQIAVMYGGRIMEISSAATLIKEPKHPYSKLLYNSMPGKTTQQKIIKGEIYSPVNPPSGCPFHPRCPHAQMSCSEKVPELKNIEAGHYSACPIV